MDYSAQELIKKKGRAKATYYIPGKGLSTQANAASAPANAVSAPANPLSAPAGALSTQAPELSTQAQGLSTQPQELNTQPRMLSTQVTVNIPVELINEIEGLKQKVRDFDKIALIIKKLCSIRALTSDELSEILNRREDYLRRKYLNKLLKKKEILYKYPEMINHPEQAYITAKKK